MNSLVNRKKSELLTIIDNLNIQIDIQRDKATIRKDRIEELEEELENERQRSDEQCDRAERLQDELNEIETYEDEYCELQEIKDLLDLIKIAKERGYLGVASAREDFETAFDKLLGYAN
jgi:chromosome segregation ATPase